MTNQIRPGRVHYATATKEVAHGAPCTEEGFVGIAVKQQVPVAGVGLGDSTITTIAIGEDFVIELLGLVTITNSGGFVVGDKLYIDPSNNTVTKTVGSNLKFGIVEAVAGERGTPTGKCRVNTNVKDLF